MTSELEAKAHWVLGLYRQGLFPMADRYGKLAVYTADPRAILPLEEFHVPKRLARVVKQGRFDVVVNRDFAGVVRGCSERDSTWISDEILEVYCELHRLGYGHSVEARVPGGAVLDGYGPGALVGGLYGVALGGAFFGESMFYRVSEASKVCTVKLVERLRERGYALLDCQMVTDNTQKYGPKLLSRREYLQVLGHALALECRFA